MNWSLQYSMVGVPICAYAGIGHVSLQSELSSFLLEFPNDAYKLLSRILIGCSLLNQECCKLIG